MPRPKVDSEDIVNRLLDEAEIILKENGGKRLVVSEVASRAGMSQSYAYRFFATKADLIRALAQRWFDKVEAESHDAAYSYKPADVRLEDWVLAILGTKRAAYDSDPPLFMAYLLMASGHMDVVGVHAERLRADLRYILSDIVPSHRLERAMSLTEDATLLFRSPYNIAQYRAQATDERAKAVVQALIDSLTN